MTTHQRHWTRRATLTAALATSTATVLTNRARAHPRQPVTPTWYPASGHLYEIRSGANQAVIGGVAATLLSWRSDGSEKLLTHAPDEVGEGYQGKTIVPWPNRIDQGRYSVGGSELQVPINEPKRACALHGLMSFVEWKLVQHERHRVNLEYSLPPRYGYPFSLSFHNEYIVDDEGVRNRLLTKNIGSEQAPFGSANHSYIAAHSGTVDSLVLELPANTYYRTNDRLIPTDQAPVEGTDYDFRAGRAVGTTTMDTALTHLQRGSDGKAVVRFTHPDNTVVEMWVDQAYEYLQVYTDDAPETDRPARSGITVEPMTCAPNAFVSGDGLVMLRPGETHESHWGFRATK